MLVNCKLTLGTCILIKYFICEYSKSENRKMSEYKNMVNVQTKLCQNCELCLMDQKSSKLRTHLKISATSIIIFSTVTNTGRQLPLTKCSLPLQDGWLDQGIFLATYTLVTRACINMVILKSVVALNSCVKHTSKGYIWKLCNILLRIKYQVRFSEMLAADSVYPDLFPRLGLSLPNHTWTVAKFHCYCQPAALFVSC